ncbi:hypothetical protein C1752_11511 [Acaryochloris thomasi RCC1774]|uniref:Uncharacterized protein n=1 Tax=Acaryochloris thomasi RCC1774 TaxID=1764569 RepID=A0A2W1J7T8_9CYAN|nr:hypothetical protein [Acaryochloris thomasi]PZD70509.1 hypothetical protein C1752_11511 [Acaryochloris thomasi RCC1774]
MLVSEDPQETSEIIATESERNPYTDSKLHHIMDFAEETPKTILIRKSPLTKYLKLSSSFFAILGGILLAANIPVSGYGFIFLGLSSGQLVMASIKEQDQTMMVYSISLFFFVDCMGIYRWLIS